MCGIGDFAGGIVAMSCSEDTIVLIPFQRILTKISHRLSQIRDVGGVSGDIGGIRRHGIVGGFQLRAVNGIGAASRQVAIFNVGDFAGGLGAMSCREYTIVLIPFQRILTKISHRLSQVRDVGGVSGNIGSVIGLLRAAIDAFDEAGPDAAFEQGLAVIVDGLAKRRLVVRNVEGPRKGDD